MRAQVEAGNVDLGRGRHGRRPTPIQRSATRASSMEIDRMTSAARRRRTAPAERGLRRPRVCATASCPRSSIDDPRATDTTRVPGTASSRTRHRRLLRHSRPSRASASLQKRPSEQRSSGR
ncbi:MAG: hypothetical protein U5K43_01125 [Halofilum sp. (in: g-proteobacteria)]|nr:hypothetical protein [Halofilum sp. (in: g-proteobacteria)]